MPILDKAFTMTKPKYQIGDRFIICGQLVLSRFCQNCGKKYYYFAYSDNMLDLYFCNSCQGIPDYDPYHDGT